MSCVVSVRETTLAPGNRESSAIVCDRLALGMLSWNSAYPSEPPVAVTVEWLTIPFCKPITLKTCWATSSTRLGATARSKLDAWMILRPLAGGAREPDCAAMGAGAEEPDCAAMSAGAEEPDCAA